MARLLKSEYPMPQYDSDFYMKHPNNYFEDSQKALDEIPDEKIFSHPYADGHALYYVVSLSPLVLQHIPFLDAWRLPDAHIRGLRKQDILDHIARRKAIKGLFANK